MTTYVIAIDPGTVTGLAAWSEDGLVWSAQGPPTMMLHSAVIFARSNHVALWVVEGAFVGGFAGGAKDSCVNYGFVRGWLAARSMTAPVWDPIATSWRKSLGFDQGRGMNKRAIQEEQARAHAAPHKGREFTESETHEAEAICMAQAGWERMLKQRG